MAKNKNKEEKDFKKGRSNSRNGKRYYSKETGQGKPVPGDDVEGKKAGAYDYNAPTWYGSGQPVTDAASLAYSNPLGDPLQISTYLQNNATKLTQKVVLPGIMAIGVQPLLFANDGTDPLATIQLVSQKIYSFIRHANSGSKNYERSDLMMYIGAVADIYSLIAWATLAYGLCFTYEQKNKYYGKALVEALGFDYDDLTGNLSDFRGYINTLIQLVNTFYIPTNLTYIDRKMNLYSHIIKDADDPKGCVYLFRPESFLKWSSKTYQTGTSLDWMNNEQDGDAEYNDDASLFNHTIKYEDFRMMASILVEAISSDEDAGVISGDILKAYKDAGGVRTLSLIPTEYRVEPTYSIEALEVINNLTLTGAPVKGTGTDLPGTSDNFAQTININCKGIHQYNNEIISDPFFGGRQLAITDDNFANACSSYYGPIFSIHDKTSPELNMIVSRLKACTEYVKQALPGGNSYHYYRILEGGSEVCTRIRIYVNDANMPAASLITDGVTKGVSADNLKLLDNIVTFDWHPIIYNKVTQTNSLDIIGIMYDFDNYTVEKPSTLRKMNRVALLAMFNVLSSQ